MASLSPEQVPFLAALRPASREAVLALATKITVPRGERLFAIGEPAAQCYLILDGKVKLTRLARRQRHIIPHHSTMPPGATVRRGELDLPARESLLWVMGPGDMFGELSLFDQGRRSTSATTITCATLLRFEGAELSPLVAQRQDVTSAMLHQLATRLRRSDDHAAGMVLSDVPGRVAWLIMHLVERFGSPAHKNGTPARVRHDLTQSEIAQVVGASRETVNKALTDFEARGVIEVRPKEILVLQPGRLIARMD